MIMAANACLYIFTFLRETKVCIGTSTMISFYILYKFSVVITFSILSILRTISYYAFVYEADAQKI